MLAILTTHPIQYQVPLWQALTRDGGIPFEVWYFSSHSVAVSHDQGFGRSFAWDIDLLSGYPHSFLEVPQGATPNSFWHCRARESLSDRIRSRGAKAVWIQGWQVAGYWQAVWAAKQVGAEVWLRGESNDLAPTLLWKRPIKAAALEHLFKRIDHFLCIGTANRRLYEKFKVNKDRLHLAPYAVDNARFADQAAQIRSQRRKIRAEWGIEEDAFCVLFCGKFIAKKRPLDLVKAAQASAEDRKRRNLHLLFVGSGELGAELRAQCTTVFDAESANLSPATKDSSLPRASFAGFLNQTEISKAYVAADCLALPSDFGETWGLVVNEAMASGLPCVISDRCGCSADLGRAPQNQIFECGNIVSAAVAIETIAAKKNHPVSRDFALPTIQDTVETVKEIWLKKDRR